jgi:hypothetical protein
MVLLQYKDVVIGDGAAMHISQVHDQEITK